MRDPEAARAAIPTAPNYWVRYKDYIKNVASCEIYSTWPETTLYANILAIQSFTLNRVYHEEGTPEMMSAELMYMSLP